MAARAAKRIKNAGIARAWGAWSEQSKTRRRQLRLIAQAGAKLTKPHVVATFGRWRASLAEQKRKFAARGIDALLEEERQVAEALAEELKRERAAGEKRLAAKEEAGGAREAAGGCSQWALRIPGGVALKPAVASGRAAASAKRSGPRVPVQLRRRRIGPSSAMSTACFAIASPGSRRRWRRRARCRRSTSMGCCPGSGWRRRRGGSSSCTPRRKRIQNQGILRGWTAWHDKWEEKARQQRMITQAGARFAKPLLAASFSSWHKDFAATNLAKALITG